MGRDAPLFNPHRSSAYLWGDSEFYLPVDFHELTPEFVGLVRALLPDTWTLTRMGPWVAANPPKRELPAQGWKIHVSARLDCAARTLGTAAEILAGRGIPFKFAGDPRLLRTFNGKGADRGSSGKFIAAYPTDAQFLSTMDDLAEGLAGLAGPYILSDRRYPGSACVHYRYGQFLATDGTDAMGVRQPYLLGPQGERFADRRDAQFVCPPWADDPYPAEEDSVATRAFLAEFEVEAALSFSNVGGVYRASSAAHGGAVVLKEARPHVCYPAGTADSTTVQRKEFDILRLLAAAGLPVPEAYEIRPVWEHTFLVGQHCAGIPLGFHAIANSPALTGRTDDWPDYLNRAADVWRQLAEFVRDAHRQAVVLGDFAMNNILIDMPDNGPPQLVFIDFEGAVRTGVDEDSGVFTLPFAAPERIAGEPLTEADDHHSLAAVLLGTLAFGPTHGPYSRETAPRYVRHLRGHVPVRATLLDLLTAMLAAPPAQRPTANDVLAELDRHGVRATPPRRRPADTARWLTRVVPRTADHIVAAATPHDQQARLYPCDAAGYIVNSPACYGYGALGVQRVLAATAAVPPAHLAWTLTRDLWAAGIPAGLYTGLAGMAWALADLGHGDLHRSLLEHAYQRADDDPSLFAGRAGLGLAMVDAHDRTGRSRYLDLAEEMAAAVLRRLGAARSPSADYPEVGYAFGRAGMALLFVELAGRTGSDAHLDAAVDLLNADLARLDVAAGRVSGLAQENNGTRRLSPYWLDGTAGLTTVLSRLYTLTAAPALLPVLRMLATDLGRDAAVMTGFFSGLAGMGNALLDAHRATGEDGFLSRATRVAAAIRPYELRRAGGSAFPGEQNSRISTDFGTGSAGVLAFLWRLRHASRGATTLDLVPAEPPPAIRMHLADHRIRLPLPGGAADR
jgi:hypothetical protein